MRALTVLMTFIFNYVFVIKLFLKKEIWIKSNVQKNFLC